MTDIERVIAALGPGALCEEALRRVIDPLFSRVLRWSQETIYLANHSLGRPLDRTIADVQEGLGFWYAELDDAWTHWSAEMLAFRTRVATLIHAPGPGCIIPKASAGQGLRAVLNRHDRQIRVVATRSEFDSIDLILKAYAERGRIVVDWVTPSEGSRYRFEDFAPALAAGADLLVVSMVFFDTGQLLSDLDAILDTARSHEAQILLDLYHVAGALPVDVQALDVDFAIGGSYKYLRGGPGAAWLFAHPRRLDGRERSLDVGWFALNDSLAFDRRERPNFAGGADGWLDATPAVLPFYQARAGLEFTLAVGVERLRAYSKIQQALLTDCLAEQGVSTLDADRPHGAFLTVKAPRSKELVARLREHGVVADARGDLLRLCPDIINSSDELIEASKRIGRELRGP
ncbi:MAG: aminotransferase class V-fold PLP-dependent enzyme [Methylocystis sp.]